MIIQWANNRAAFKGGQRFVVAGLLVVAHAVTVVAPVIPEDTTPLDGILTTTAALRGRLVTTDPLDGVLDSDTVRGRL